jgi:RimJ/RimL family protein N-acetyltransferase
MAIDERLIFYEGKYVRLKVLDEQDIIESDWVGWFNNEKLCQTNQHHYFPNTFDVQRSFLSSLNGSKDKIQLGILDRDQPDKICGVVSLSNINFINRNAEIAGIQSVDNTRNNSAIFLESWSIILRHAFEQLGIKKIYGGTFHPYGFKALEFAFNFEVEGTRKRHIFKNGEYHDIILVAVFNNSVRYPSF